MADIAVPRSRFVLPRGWVLPLAIAATCLVVALYEPRFVRFANLTNVLRNASFLSIIAAGQMMVMIVGGFDISVGAVVALTSVSAALAMVGLVGAGIEENPAVWLGCLIGLVPALVIGLVNGLLVAVLRISPFMVTIGTMSIALGIAAYVTGGTPIYDLPKSFTAVLGLGQFHQLPYVVPIAAAAAFGLWFLQSETPAGRYFYAVGSNERSARQSGIRTWRYIALAYVASALLAGLTGLLLTARVGSGEATLGGTMMLESISAAVIGGVSLRGGIGRIGSVVLGALFLEILKNGMSLARIDSKYHIIVIGFVILIAVLIERRGAREGASRD